MTLVEKIIAAPRDRRRQREPDRRPRGEPGDALFVRTDVRFSHEYVTPMAESLFRAGFGPDAKVADPGASSRSAIT